jgi:DNA-binding NarL/FixJ family response regulator
MTRDAPIRTALLDDHAVVRMGYERVLNQDGRFEVVGAYSKSGELFCALRLGLHIEVLMLDYALADTDVDGAQLITTLRREYPALRILVASGHDNPATASLVLRAGAHGFLGKS